MYKSGKNVTDPVVVIYTMKNHGQGVRIGITASKRIGGAVKRNRAKRVIKAAIVNVLKKHRLNDIDIILVARVKTTTVKSQQVERALTYHLKSMVGF